MDCKDLSCQLSRLLIQASITHSSPSRDPKQLLLLDIIFLQADSGHLQQYTELMVAQVMKSALYFVTSLSRYKLSDM